MINPNCVFCECEPILMPFDDLYFCLECGEVSFKPDSHWRPLYEATIICMTEDEARYWFRRLKVTINFYAHKK